MTSVLSQNPNVREEWNWKDNKAHKLSFLSPIMGFTYFMPRILNHMLAIPFGALIWMVMRKTRKVLDANLTRIGRGRWNAKKIRFISLKTIINYGKYLIDYLYLPRITSKDLGRFFHTMDIENAHYLEYCVKQGRGVILVTCHLGHWELGGVLISRLGYRLNVLSLPSSNPQIQKYRENVRERLGINLLQLDPGQGSLGSVIGLIHALRKGEIVAMLADRESAEGSTQIDFFGEKIQFPIGAALISRLTGAPIIPSFVLLKEGIKYRATMEMPMYASRTDNRDRDIQETCQKIADTFARYIELYPDQWYNFFPPWKVELGKRGKTVGRNNENS